MATSVTQHQITFTFDSDYTVGTYVNGDYYVVAPSGLTINSISPATTGTGATFRNGSMVNPTTQEQAFDGRADSFNEGLAISFPYSASVGDSIIVATSNGEYIGTPDENYDSLGRSSLETVAILTVVSTAPASTAFRPPYVGSSKPVHLVSDLNLSLLPGLSSSSVTNLPTLSDQIRRFERVQLDYIYNPAGQGIHPSQHMAAYGGYHVKSIGEAFSRLCLDDGEAALQDLAYGIVQYGIDLYYAMLNGSTVWPTNGGHNHGRKAPMVAAAILLENADMKAQIKEWSNTHIEANADRWQDDWSFRYSEEANINLYGDTGSEADYWNAQINGIGNKAIADPYGLIDGGELPGGSYQSIVDPPSLAWSLWARNVTGFAEVWNNSSITRGDRVWNWGTWTLGDPYQYNGSGVEDGVGRYPTRHGENHFSTAYDSDFTKSVFDTHVNNTVFPPDIIPHSKSEANNINITLNRFSRQTPSGYPNYWDQYPSEPADGSYPYLDSVVIRYTIDGSEPTSSSTEYTGPFEISDEDADTNDYVIIKAKAFKSGYDESASNVSYIRVRPYIRQASVENSEDSSVTSISATFENVAEEGNALVAVASLRSRSTTITFDGSDWTYLVQHSTAPSVSIAYKTTSVSGVQTVTASHGDSSQRMAIAIYEIAGISVVDSAVSNTSETAASSTKSSGTASAVKGNYVSLAVWGGDDNGTYVGSHSFDNSFIEIDDGVSSPLSSNRARVFGAFLPISGSSTPECTITVDGGPYFSGVGGNIVFDGLPEGVILRYRDKEILAVLQR